MKISNNQKGIYAILIFFMIAIDGFLINYYIHIIMGFMATFVVAAAIAGILFLIFLISPEGMNLINYDLKSDMKLHLIASILFTFLLGMYASMTIFLL